MASWKCWTGKRVLWKEEGGAWDKTSLCSLCTEAEDRWHRAATRQQDARRTRCPWLKEPKPRGW